MQVDRGCPQGSVLGPILFNLYVRKSMLSLPSDVNYYSYADDSYAVCHGPNLTLTVQRLEEVIVGHISQLTLVGMIVNKSKTEIIQFLPSNATDQRIRQVRVGDETVVPVDTFKVLGLVFDTRLCWKPHIENLKKN